MSLYFFPRFLLLASLQLSDKMPKRINPYWFNGSLERNICQLLCRRSPHAHLPSPCHIATLPHCHIFHPSHSPKQPGCFFGVDQRSLRLQNHSPSQGSHEENPKMIGLLQINITRCHSLPPDQLCLVIETSRIVFFVSPPPFFGYFFHYNFSKNYMARGVSFNDDRIVPKMFETSVDQAVRALPKELEEEFHTHLFW